MTRQLSTKPAAIYKRSLRARKAAGDNTDLRRKYASEEERREARKEARRQDAQRLRRSRGMTERAPKAERPKPVAIDRQAVKRRTVVRDLLSRSPADLRFAPAERHDPSATEAFIRANPDRYEVIPMDHPWTSPETLSASHRKTIEGMR